MQANDLFTEITNQLIADIGAGAGDWHMPWYALATAGTPTNLDGRPYRGINACWLPCVAAANGWTSGLFATYRSLQRHGAHVRRGSKGTPVVLWKPTVRSAADESESGSDNTADTSAGSARRSLIARVFTVFAAEQADGTDELIARHHAQRLADPADRIEAADRYIAATGARVIEHGNRAYYEPAADTIHVPTRAQFHSAELHASTRQIRTDPLVRGGRSAGPRPHRPIRHRRQPRTSRSRLPQHARRMEPRRHRR